MIYVFPRWAVTKLHQKNHHHNKIRFPVEGSVAIDVARVVVKRGRGSAASLLAVFRPGGAPKKALIGMGFSRNATPDTQSAATTSELVLVSYDGAASNPGSFSIVTIRTCVNADLPGVVAVEQRAETKAAVRCQSRQHSARLAEPHQRRSVAVILSPPRRISPAFPR